MDNIAELEKEIKNKKPSKGLPAMLKQMFSGLLSAFINAKQDDEPKEYSDELAKLEKATQPFIGDLERKTKFLGLGEYDESSKKPKGPSKYKVHDHENEESQNSIDNQRKIDKGRGR